MKPHANTVSRPARGARGMTVMELLVTIFIGSIVLSLLAVMFLFGLRSFVAMGNYTELDARSRQAVDVMSHDMRMASQVVDFKTNGPTVWLKLANTNLNVGPPWTNTYTWDSVARTLTSDANGTFKTNLTECDQWTFSLYQRTPLPNSTNTFYPATNSAGKIDVNLCKLIDMTWKCSRTILGKKMNTESVQTAQIVLRNKQ